MFTQNDPVHNRNTVIALTLSLIVLLFWQFTVEYPKLKKRAEQDRAKLAQELEKQKKERAEKSLLNPKAAQQVEPGAPRAEVLALSPRVKFANNRLHGSISLKGARIDDLTLADYRETLSPKSPEVVLFSPSGAENVYFAEFGWLAAAPGIKTPDPETIWKTEGGDLSPSNPLSLSWDNGEGLLFSITVSLDENYMFNVRQAVKNQSGKPASLSSYGLLSRSERSEHDNFSILHTGPLGVMDGTLKEITYKSLSEEGKKTFSGASGWIGITDKYWFKSLAPEGRFTANFNRVTVEDAPRYQVDYVSEPKQALPGESVSFTTNFFAGAKEVKLLDKYRDSLHLPLFDRAIDFGYFYFLTRPLFALLSYFYGLVGNFGLAILLLTVLVKLIMYPLAHKSYHSMAVMKKLQPEITRLKELHKDDKMEMNRAVMQLYRKEKANPAAGCLPLLIQIPVFFSLYKVLFVTIEMRHAPFFGWIKDLSAADPTSFFNVFGLMPWPVPGFLHIGIWPLLMCVTMYTQQLMSPAPSDPTQAKLMRYMPVMFLVMFSSFPAGLVIYWTWSNLLSIIQQFVINRSVSAKHK